MQLLSRTSAEIGDVDEYDFETCYTRLNPERGIHEADLVAAMLKHHANPARVARELGRSRSEVVRVIARNDEYRSLSDELREIALDLVEDAVMKQAVLGDGTQARFILQTLGKDRGYVTRNEATGKDGAPLESKIDPSKLDNDTLEKLMAAKFGHNSGDKP